MTIKTIRDKVKERRSHIRYPVCLAARLKKSGVPPVCLEGTLIDVSSGGVRVRVSEELPIGAAVLIEWPDPPFYVEGDAAAGGMVISCEMEKEGFRVGIRFSDPDSEVTGNLLKWVHMEVSRERRAQSCARRLSGHKQKIRF